MNGTSDAATASGALPAFASNTTAFVAPASTLTLLRPTGTVAGSLLLAQVSVRGSASVSAPAGWTLVSGSDSGALGALRQLAFWKAATATEPSSYTWNLGASVAAAGGVMRLSGIDVSNPIVAAGSRTGSTTTMTAPAQLQSSGNALLVAFYSSTNSGDSHGAVTGMAGRYAASAISLPAVPAESGLRISARTQLNAREGSTGDRLSSLGAAREHAALLIVLRPSSPGTLTLPVPSSTAAGDLLLASVSVRPRTATVVAPIGWTTWRTTTQTAGETLILATFYRVAGSAEPASYAWNFSAAHGGAVGGMLALRGVSTTSPVLTGTGNTTPNGFSHSVSSISPTVADSLLVSAHAFPSASSWTAPSGMTERVDRASLPPLAALGVSLSMNTESRPSTGATGARIALASSLSPADSGSGAAHLLALRPGPPILNHIRIEHPSGSGLTCAPSTLTVRACANASCSTAYTAGVSVSLSSSLAGTLWPDGGTVSIPVGASTASVRVQLTTPVTALLGVSSSLPAALNAPQCNFGSPSCSFSAALSGLRLSVSNHLSEAPQTLRVAAVRASDSALVCVPAFASVTRSVNFACSYANPSTGTLPVRLGGFGINSTGSGSRACGSRNFSLAFDASGEASVTLLYADVGRVNLNASYTGSSSTGDVGLSMLGSTSFVAAPASLLFSGLPSTELTAGAPFAFSVTARGSAGNAMPNFGREGESLSLSHLRRSPTGAGAIDGLFTPGGASPAAAGFSYAEARWSEVGRIDLSATLASGSYLGSGFSASGTTGTTGSSGALGPFRPQHLRVLATAACGVFSYAGQPMAVQVSARNAQADVTRNYAGSLATARAVDFSDAAGLGLGSLSSSGWPASSFSAGEASGSLAYNFSSKASGPGTLLLRATESGAGGVSSAALAGSDASAPLRSGRLQLQAATGSAAAALSLPLRLEQWQGASSGSWALAKDDSCTLAPLLLGGAAATAQSGRVDGRGAAASWSSAVLAVAMTGSVGSIRLAGAGVSGSVDLALNLGATASDRACLPAPRPSSTPLNLPWLRSRQGSLNGCGAREDSDPSSRASFTALDLSQQKKVHERQID